MTVIRVIDSARLDGGETDSRSFEAAPRPLPQPRASAVTCPTCGCSAARQRGRSAAGGGAEGGDRGVQPQTRAVLSFSTAIIDCRPSGFPVYTRWSGVTCYNAGAGLVYTARANGR